MKSSNDVNKTALLPLARYICACAKMTSDMHAVGITVFKCPQVKSSKLRDSSRGRLKSWGDIKFHVNCRGGGGGGVTINFGFSAGGDVGHVKIAKIKLLKFSSLSWFLKINLLYLARQATKILNFYFCKC